MVSVNGVLGREISAIGYGVGDANPSLTLTTTGSPCQVESNPVPRAHVVPSVANVTKHEMEDAGRASRVVFNTTQHTHDVQRVAVRCTITDGRGTGGARRQYQAEYNDGATKDPHARACEKTTGPIPRFTGPVPSLLCNPPPHYCDESDCPGGSQYHYCNEDR